MEPRCGKIGSKQRRKSMPTLVIIGIFAFLASIVAVFVIWLASIRPYIRTNHANVAEVRFGKGTDQSIQIVQDYFSARSIANKKGQRPWFLLWTPLLPIVGGLLLILSAFLRVG